MKTLSAVLELNMDRDTHTEASKCIFAIFHCEYSKKNHVGIIG
jgi:hypothetical protein